jgi:hypothetical protein
MEPFTIEGFLPNVQSLKKKIKEKLKLDLKKLKKEKKRHGCGPFSPNANVSSRQSSRDATVSVRAEITLLRSD